MNLLKRLVLLSALLFVATVTAQDATQPKTQPRGRAALVPADATVLRDLAYGPHERNKLDLYMPKSDGPVPLIVWVHGGGWERGSKNGAGPSLDLIRKGYAVASINYRLSQHAVFPAQIEDCKAAVRWLRANAEEYKLDP